MDNSQIDTSFIDSLGLDLDENQKSLLRDHIVESLQMRIGLRLSQELTDDQLHELETQFVPDAADSMEDIVRKQQAVTDWLQKNHPDYEKVVQEEAEKLQQALRERPGDIDSILA